MALITKKEFAELCGKTTAWLSNYTNPARKTRIIVRQDGLIDTTDPMNISFLQKHAVTTGEDDTTAPQAKGKKTNLSKTVAAPPDNEVNELVELDGNASVMPAVGDVLSKISAGEWKTLAGMLPEYQVIEKILKYNDTVKREKEIEKLKLEIEKKRGEVIPVAPIEVLVFQFKQHILTQGKLTYEAFLNEIGHKYSITSDDMAEYRKYFINNLNNSMLRATENFKKGLESALTEYAAKRGVGERTE